MLPLLHTLLSSTSHSKKTRTRDRFSSNKLKKRWDTCNSSHNSSSPRTSTLQAITLAINSNQQQRSSRRQLQLAHRRLTRNRQLTTTTNTTSLTMLSKLSSRLSSKLNPSRLPLPRHTTALTISSPKLPQLQLQPLPRQLRKLNSSHMMITTGATIRNTIRSTLKLPSLRLTKLHLTAQLKRRSQLPLQPTTTTEALSHSTPRQLHRQARPTTASTSSSLRLTTTRDYLKVLLSRAISRFLKSPRILSPLEERPDLECLLINEPRFPCLTS